MRGPWWNPEGYNLTPSEASNPSTPTPVLAFAALVIGSVATAILDRTPPSSPPATRRLPPPDLYPPIVIAPPAPSAKPKTFRPDGANASRRSSRLERKARPRRWLGDLHD